MFYRSDSAAQNLWSCVSLTQRNTREVPPSPRVYQDCLPFCYRAVFHAVRVPDNLPIFRSLTSIPPAESPLPSHMIYTEFPEMRVWTSLGPICPLQGSRVSGGPESPRPWMYHVCPTSHGSKHTHPAMPRCRPAGRVALILGATCLIKNGVLLFEGEGILEGS